MNIQNSIPSGINLEFLKKSKKVFFVAMQAEFDSDSTSSEVIYSGVGKARASRALVKYVFDHIGLLKAGQMPLIVSLGTAGSGKFKRGDIVMCDRFVNNGDDFIRETLEFHTLPDPTPYVCASSDWFISEYNFNAEEVKKMREKYDCLDMEAYALANICATFGLQFCAVKCISDGADDTILNFDAELPKFRAKLNEFAKAID